MDARLDALKRWLTALPSVGAYTVQPASADASFRRYFRVAANGRSYIAMDAPPEKEACAPFVQIAQHLRDRDVNAPEVIASDLKQGFLLLTDFGATDYLQVLGGDRTDSLYADAISTLVQMQSSGLPAEYHLPSYTKELLNNEMALFTDWLISHHLSLTLTELESQQLAEVFAALTENALSQPRVFVHRDYHCRNLMFLTRHNPGVIDFQDALLGPVSYDLVSLLKDCYIDWPRARIVGWVARYRQLAGAAGINVGKSGTEFLRWFDRMGVQRHLKASGIFARLYHRDGKAKFLGDIPRTLNYIVATGQDDEEIRPLAQLIESRVLPQLDVAHASAVGQG